MPEAVTVYHMLHGTFFVLTRMKVVRTADSVESLPPPQSQGTAPGGQVFPESHCWLDGGKALIVQKGARPGGVRRAQGARSARGFANEGAHSIELNQFRVSAVIRPPTHPLAAHGRGSEQSYPRGHR